MVPNGVGRVLFIIGVVSYCMAHAPSSPACTKPLAVVQSMTFRLREAH